MDFDKIIRALHDVGVQPAPIFVLVVIFLLLRHGPKWIATISSEILAHRRFEIERDSIRAAVAIAWANQVQPRLPLAEPTTDVHPSQAPARQAENSEKHENTNT
jgi:hypothetical protein